MIRYYVSLFYNKKARLKADYYVINRQFKPTRFSLNKDIFNKRTSLSGVGIVIRVSPIFTLRRRSTIFGTTEHNLRVRNGNEWIPSVINRLLNGSILSAAEMTLLKTSLINKRTSLSGVGIFLFSHSVARALSSALQGLTSVFGMGTGGPRWERVDPLRHQHQLLIMRFLFGSPSWTRTNDNSVNSRVLYRLSYGGICFCFSKSGDSWGNRTPVAGVRGRSLNRLTNEPCG